MKALRTTKLRCRNRQEVKEWQIAVAKERIRQYKEQIAIQDMQMRMNAFSNKVFTLWPDRPAPWDIK